MKRLGWLASPLPTIVVVVLGTALSIAGSSFPVFRPSSFGTVGEWAAATAAMSVVALTQVQARKSERMQIALLHAANRQADQAEQGRTELAVMAWRKWQVSTTVALQYRTVLLERGYPIEKVRKEVPLADSEGPDILFRLPSHWLPNGAHSSVSTVLLFVKLAENALGICDEEGMPLADDPGEVLLRLAIAVKEIELVGASIEESWRALCDRQPIPGLREIAEEFG